jgi:hypothetical protein
MLDMATALRAYLDESDVHISYDREWLMRNGWEWSSEKLAWVLHPELGEAGAQVLAAVRDEERADAAGRLLAARCVLLEEMAALLQILHLALADARRSEAERKLALCEVELRRLETVDWTR